MTDEPRQRIGHAVEHELLGEPAGLRIDLAVGNDVRRVDDGRVQTCLHAVMQEHAVEDGAHVRREPERHVGHAEHREHTRQLAFDGADALDGLVRGVDPFRLAGRQRERKRVEHELIGRQAELITGEVVDASGDLELAIGRTRHALLIDRERDDARTVVAHQRQDGVAALAPVLEVDAVDDATPRVRLERRVDHVGVGAVDDQWRVDAHLQRFHDGAHLVGLVAAFGHRNAEVERMRAAFDLPACDAEDAVVVVGQQQPLDRARSLRVHALTDEQRRGLLVQLDGMHAAGEARCGVERLARRALHSTDVFDELADVIVRRAAAAADDVDAVLAHEARELGCHRHCLERIVRAALDVERQPGVGDAGHGERGVAREVANRLAHVLRTGGAVEADDVDME